MPADELNIEQVDQFRAYLEQRHLLAPAEPASISQLAGGVSSRTMLVERPCGERWVFKQALASLRVHVEWLSSPDRSAREAEGARALASILPDGAVPRVIFEDRAHHLFGMTALPASSANWKTVLLAGEVDLVHFRLAGALLARLHRESAARRDEFAAAFHDRSFFESLRLEPYYEYTAAAVPETAPFLHALCESVRANRHALVHGDFSPKNLMLLDRRMVLLDHEVIHFGDPGFDLGFVTAHFLSKAHHQPASRQALLEGATEFWREYQQESRCASDLEPRAAAHALGCLLARVAGRSQLEYLSDEERRRQRFACIRLLNDPPNQMPQLAARFIEKID